MYSPLSQVTSPSQKDFQDTSDSAWLAGRPKAARWTDYPDWEEEEEEEEEEEIRKAREVVEKAKLEVEKAEEEVQKKKEEAEEIQEQPKKKRQRTKKGRKDAPGSSHDDLRPEAPQEADEIQEQPKNKRQRTKKGRKDAPRSSNDHFGALEDTEGQEATLTQMLSEAIEEEADEIQEQPIKKRQRTKKGRKEVVEEVHEVQQPKKKRQPTKKSRKEAPEESEGQEEGQEGTKDLWVGAADKEVPVGRGNPPIRKNSSSMVCLGPTVETFLNYFEAGSTKVMEDEMIWLSRGALARTTAKASHMTAFHAQAFHWHSQSQRGALDSHSGQLVLTSEGTCRTQWGHCGTARYHARVRPMLDFTHSHLIALLF